MSVTQTRARPAVILGMLFAGAFVMGCAEMLVVGMIDLIAADMSVSLAAAGALVTANALGLAVGGPLLTLLTARFDRRAVLLATTSVFFAANLLPAAFADYGLFLVVRVVAGAMQGLFIAAAMVVATAIVPPARSGRAMAVVISGFATASAIGLPLGTLLGQWSGWRGSFVAVVIATGAVFAALIVVVPSVPAPADVGALGQARHAFAPRVLAVLCVSFLTFAAMLAAITYLVPFLGEVTLLDGPVVTAYLLIYGISTTLGSAIGGRFADGDAGRMLVVGAVGVLASLAVLLLFGSDPWWAALGVLGIGMLGMATAPSIQHRVGELSGPGAPLAASLPASAVNAGIAVGSLAGGTAIELGGVRDAVVAGMAIAVVAIAVAIVTRRLRRPEEE